MAQPNPAQTVLSLGIVALLFYLFRAQISSAFASVIPGAPVISSFAGSPTYGYAAGTNPVAVNFALTAATGDQYPTPPPGYARNSTGGITALPDPNGIGGGFAT